MTLRVRAERSALLALVLALFAGTSSCTRKDPPAALSLSNVAIDGLPCFPDGGPIAFRVDGVPVPEAAVQRIAAFLRASEPGYSAEEAKKVAVLNVLLPAAHAYANAARAESSSSTRRQALTRAADVAARIRAGAEFTTLLAESSDPKSMTAGSDGEMLARSRSDPLFAEAAFAAGKGEVVGPVVTAFGVYVLQVVERMDGASPQQDRLKVRQILHPFEPEVFLKNPAIAVAEARARGKDAKVAVDDEVYKKIIPLDYRR